MPRNAYHNFISETAAVADADNGTLHLPIIGSHEYTRYSVSVNFSGQGSVSLLGSLSGSGSQEGADVPAANADGYVEIKNSSGDSILSNAGSGLYSFKLATFLRGGVMLSFSGLNANATVEIQMMGNVRGRDVSRSI